MLPYLCSKNIWTSRNIVIKKNIYIRQSISWYILGNSFLCNKTDSNRNIKQESWDDFLGLFTLNIYKTGYNF